jgi:bacterioferritin (cytochrome b1)
MPGSSFSVDVAAIRDRARQKMDRGPVTEADDPTTRRLMEKILAEEEEHADDIVDLLGT